MMQKTLKGAVMNMKKHGFYYYYIVQDRCVS